MDNNLVGQTIQGRYYVVKQLGRGGVGVTFLARDQQCFDSLCVVKQLQPKDANAKTLEIARRLFNREAEIMNRLGDCDRIPRLLAYFEHQNDFFLVQELIEGHDLSQEILPGQPWSEAKTIALVKDVLEVLSVVQQYSVIHRDLKPSNLMRRDKDRKIVLIDFGSVKQVSTQIIDAAGQVKQTVAVGTKSYMPMEQMMGRPGFYSDIYAVGVIAIQALTGVPPKQFTINQSGELIWRNLLDNRTHYQPQFLNILDKMVRYRHQERYGSAGIVLSDLEQLDAERNNNKETILISKPNSSNTASSNSQGSGETLIIPDKSKNNSKPNISPTLVTNPNNDGSSASAHKPKTQVKLWAGIATLVTLVIGGVSFWLFLQAKNSESEAEFSLYKSSTEDFQVNYPESWSKQNRDDFFASGVVFFSPLENDLDRFKERVSVFVEQLAGDISLAQYTDDSLAEIEKLSDPNVGKAQTSNLGANEARQVIYVSKENGTDVRRMQTWSVKNDKAYVITYTAQPDSYETYLPTVEKIIRSFSTVE